MSTGGAIVRLVWKCNKPNDVAMIQACETLMRQAALKQGMDTAVIRHTVHTTTKVDGKYVRTTPHITGDILDTKVNKGFALHYNVAVSSSGISPLPNTANAPNPKAWALKFKEGTGFVLVEEDGTETVTVAEDIVK